MTELSRLDPLKLVSTAELLARRVHERFPDSGLSRLSKELVQLASDDPYLKEFLFMTLPPW